MSIPPSAALIPLWSGLVDLRIRQVLLPNGGRVVLTTREVALLARLATAPGEVISAEALLRAVWGRRWTGEPAELGVVRNSVFKLRRKIERDLSRPEHILTIQGEGYRFVPTSNPARPPPERERERRKPAGVAPLPEAGDPWDATWDVGRHEDAARAVEALRVPRRPVLLLAPWRCGKTWMLRRLLAARSPGDVAVRLDPRALPSEAWHDLRELALHLALRVAEAIDAPEEAAVGALAGAGPVSWRLKRWMERTVLPQLTGRLILAFEDLDHLARAPVMESLLAVLRSWCEEERPEWSRIRLVYSSSASAVRFATSLAGSPPDLGLQIHLAPLTATDLETLGLRAGLSADPEGFDWLRTTVGGHP